MDRDKWLISTNIGAFSAWRQVTSNERRSQWGQMISEVAIEFLRFHSISSNFQKAIVLDRVWVFVDAYLFQAPG